MILKNYKEVSEFEFVNTMNKHVELGDYKVQKIKDWLGNSREFHIVRLKDKEQPNFLIRLTIPLYGLFIFFALLVLPISYIINGSWGYSHKRGVGYIYSLWARKLGF